MSGKNSTQDRKTTSKIDTSKFRKPLKLSLIESWQDFVSSVLLPFYALFPHKRSRCEAEGHMVSKSTAGFARCKDCGAAIRPGAKIRGFASMDMGQDNNSFRVWHNDDHL